MLFTNCLILVINVNSNKNYKNYSENSQNNSSLNIISSSSSTTTTTISLSSSSPLPLLPYFLVFTRQNRRFPQMNAAFWAKNINKPLPPSRRCIHCSNKHHNRIMRNEINAAASIRVNTVKTGPSSLPLTTLSHNSLQGGIPQQRGNKTVCKFCKKTFRY